MLSENIEPTTDEKKQALTWARERYKGEKLEHIIATAVGCGFGLAANRTRAEMTERERDAALADDVARLKRERDREVIQHARDLLAATKERNAARDEVERLKAESLTDHERTLVLNPAKACTCGSGGHPRTCKRHPDAKAAHILQLNYEGAGEENMELRAEVEALRGERDEWKSDRDAALEAVDIAAGFDTVGEKLELRRALATVERQREALAEALAQMSMACENPRDDCDCSGCATAASVGGDFRTLLTETATKGDGDAE